MGRRKKNKVPYREQKRIIAQYRGVMTEEEIHAEFGIMPSKQKYICEILDRQEERMAKAHRCWFCANASSMFKCIYVRSCIGNQPLRYYNGTQFGKGKKISYCPKYKEG